MAWVSQDVTHAGTHHLLENEPEYVWECLSSIWAQSAVVGHSELRAAATA